jgi:hypothetical protein
LYAGSEYWEKTVLKKSRLLRHEPEFIFRYHDLKPYTAPLHTVLPDPDAGETKEFFYQEKTLDEDDH